MILVRQVFQAKFGMAGLLAIAMRESSEAVSGRIGGGARWRVLTDLSGPFDTVVLELEAESLAAWERTRAELFNDSSLTETFARTTGLIDSGRSEFYTIEAQG